MFRLFFAVIDAVTDPSSDSILETVSTTNPLLNENGQFAEPKEAVKNFAELIREWDPWGKFVSLLPTLILAIVVFVIGLFLSKLIANLLEKAMRRKGVDFAVYHFIARMVLYVIRVCFLLISLSMFFNVTSLLATLGAAGVAIALGLQDSVAQFVSGIQILINHPFKAGDYVEVAGVAGSITEIGFMNTILTTLDNKRIIVPNSDITKNHITNYSAEDKRRVDLTFSISYSEDIAKAKKVILGVAERNDKVLKDPPPEVYVGAHAASSIELTTRVWCCSQHYWDVFFAMQENVKLSFDANGINIPFEQLDVHIIEEK